jgi:uncharacterized lipoprotein YmbA
MKCWATWSIVLLFLTGCAAIHPDRFYALEPEPAGTTAAPPGAATAVSLKVSVPSLVDRNELVLRNGSGITVLEHERWAAPLADQVAVVLGQNIEQRRPDLMISSRRLSQPGGATIAVSADIVELSASRGGGVSMEVRWRIDRLGNTQALDNTQAIAGREIFRQPASANDYAQVVRAVSDCIARLADRLAQQLPATGNPSG